MKNSESAPKKQLVAAFRLFLFFDKIFSVISALRRQGDRLNRKNLLRILWFSD